MKDKDQNLLEEAHVQTLSNKIIQDYIKNGCEGDLDLMDKPIKSLPNNLQHVGGKLVLLACRNLETLPDNLTVEGNLDLRFCVNIKKLPDNLTVGGALLLQDCDSLTTLPKNLKIADTLRMPSTNIQLSDIKHYIDVKEVSSYNFSQEEFDAHNEDLKKYEKLREKLPELEGIF